MTTDAVHYYWRPGCPFCSMLRRGLDKAGIVTVDHNIWEDPDAAATVREHAGGNETVPTVVIGGVGLVNPSAKQVAAHLERVAKACHDLWIGVVDGAAATAEPNPDEERPIHAD